MLVKIENTNWFLDKEIQEGTVSFSINSRKYDAFSCLQEFEIGKNVEVFFGCLITGQKWRDVFNKNLNSKKELIKTGKSWSYDGYGEIVSINPIMVDYGDFSLEHGNWTHDEKVVGQFVYIKISRLDILKMPVHGR